MHRIQVSRVLLLVFCVNFGRINFCGEGTKASSGFVSLVKVMGESYRNFGVGTLWLGTAACMGGACYGTYKVYNWLAYDRHELATLRKSKTANESEITRLNQEVLRLSLVRDEVAKIRSENTELQSSIIKKDLQINENLATLGTLTKITSKFPIVWSILQHREEILKPLEETFKGHDIIRKGKSELEGLPEALAQATLSHFLEDRSVSIKHAKKNNVNAESTKNSKDTQLASLIPATCRYNFRMADLYCGGRTK